MYDSCHTREVRAPFELSTDSMDVTGFPLTAVSHFLLQMRGKLISSESARIVLIWVLDHTLSPPAPHNPFPCDAALSPCHSQSTPHSVASYIGRSPTQYLPCSVVLAHTSVLPPSGILPVALCRGSLATTLYVSSPTQAEVVSREFAVRSSSALGRLTSLLRHILRTQLNLRQGGSGVGQVRHR